MNDIVVVSLENWDDIWRRNQFVCSRLAARFPASRVLFIGLPRDLSHAVRTGRWRALGDEAEKPNVLGLPNLTWTRPVKLLPDSVAAGRTVNDLLFRRHVRRAMRSAGVKRPILWLNAHSAVHMVGRMGEAGVVYDVTDDWTSLNQRESVRQRTIAQDAELCARAHAVIVCSQRLHEMKRGATRSLHLIANGVDAGHYAVADDPKAAAVETAAWRRPVLGYTGTVHGDRVDVGLVRAIAQSWPGTVVLVGPDHLRTDEAATLDVPNVRRVGPVPYEQVPAYMAGFDACIVPHRVTPFTESLNPIKLWEYLAAGKPIISTPVAGFRDFPSLVRLAATADEFVAAAHASIAESSTPEGLRLREERRAVAREHSWERRVDDIVKVLDGVTAADGPGPRS